MENFEYPNSLTAPLNLVFVRHGQSEANVLISHNLNGDESLFNEQTMTVPDRDWRLTDLGREQAKLSGQWITDNLPDFDRFIVSPYVRTRETAAHLNLDKVNWEENRTVRERSWGEIDSIPFSEFKSRYPHNFLLKEKDPLYWRPPAGESIAQVSETRVRNLLRNLYRESTNQNVLIVSHGEFIQSSRLVLESWSDEDFIERSRDRKTAVKNCEIIHYSRVNPETQEISDRVQWVRRVWPENGKITVGEWKFFEKITLTNQDLLDRVEGFKKIFPTNLTS